MSDYEQFLATKKLVSQTVGREVEADAFHSALFGFQRDLTRWALRKGRSAIFADCVAADTLINTPNGDMRIDILAASGNSFEVFSVNGGGEVVVSQATCAFQKGTSRLYEVRLQSGKAITVTPGHRFLTNFGWRYAGDLVVGEQLAISSVYLLQSNLGYGPLAFPLNVQRCEQTVSDCPMSYSEHSHQCDVLPLMVTDNVLEFVPSLDDVRGQFLLVSRGDVQACKSGYSHLHQFVYHLSMQGCVRQDMNVVDDAQYQLLSFDHKEVALSNDNVLPVRQYAIPAPLVPEFHPLADEFCGVFQSEPCGISFDTVVSIKYITEDAYFDLCVPQTGNYLANGIWSHNTGLGKSFMQLDWSRMTGERTIILAPLAVASQTVAEGQRWGIPIAYARNQLQAPKEAITITNYEILKHFDVDQYGAVVLDESSILKSFDGKVRTQLIETFRDTPLRLCCTATPAPNDIAELANHAEFLGIMSRVEMLSAFFVHDDNGWRLKGHASNGPFYKWLASWSMSIRKPSNLGYLNDGYDLPELSIKPVIVQSNYVPEGMLFHVELHGIQERAKVRKGTVAQRVAAAVELVRSEPDEQWLIWCGLNDESSALAKALPEAVEVVGSDSPDYKVEELRKFAAGETRILISKLSIAGFGMNFQRCARMVFVGLSDSYEQYYQGIRRCYRFGQTRPVHAYIVLSDIEEAIYVNVLNKEAEANKMSDELIQHVSEFEKAEIGNAHEDFDYKTGEASGKDWRLLLGDSSERMKEITDSSVDLSVFSPPFASLYVYSPTERDLGNSSSPEQFWHHFEFISRELLRVLKPGRHACVHVQQLTTTLATHGYIGMIDFRGQTIAHFQSQGFIYYGEVCLDKNPQQQAIRTHSKGLLFNQFHKDSTWSRPALADYILLFKKPGENEVPVLPELTNEEWIQYAHPVWYNIRESDTLNVAEGRTTADERHICALQLETIERCIKLWSNKGETVFSPFGGIGSEPYMAVKLGRKAIGIELKPEYFKVAVKNLKRAENEAQAVDLFDFAGVEVEGKS